MNLEFDSFDENMRNQTKEKCGNMGIGPNIFRTTQVTMRYHRSDDYKPFLNINKPSRIRIALHRNI